nr:Uncharacterised protein [Streptococcus thermophilus]
MSDAKLSWEKSDNKTRLLALFAIPQFFIFGELFDNYIIAFCIAIGFAVPFLFLGAKRYAHLDATTLTYNVGGEERTRPVEQISRIIQEPMSGSMVLEFTDGTSDTIDNGGDEQGVSEFVDQAQRYLS